MKRFCSMINRKIHQKREKHEERAKIILYLTSVLLLGCLGWIFYSCSMCRPTGKNIFKDKKHASGDHGRDAAFAFAVPEAFRCQPFVSKAHASYRNCGCFLMILILQFLYLYYVRYWVGYDNLLVLDEAWHMQKNRTYFAGFCMIPIFSVIHTIIQL